MSPLKLTLFQSMGATLTASTLAIVAYSVVGVHFPGIWYQLAASLFVASVVAPIFLYPGYRTSQRLHRANAIMQSQATTDHLTGLPNMAALNNKLDELINSQHPTQPFALHFFDVDRFKQVNDSLGHDIGNELIIEIGKRLQNWVGEAGFVSRFGGDEFVVIQYATTTQTWATHFASELGKYLSMPCELSGHDLDISTSIGTALYPLHYSEKEQLLKAADLALYKAKETRHTNCMFDPTFAQEADNRRHIESALRDAIKHGTLKPYFHAIVHAKNPFPIVGFEALSRIELASGEVLQPNQFIPIAENTGAIIPIGAHILQQACLECATWQKDLFVSVNVSPIQLTQSNFLQTVQNALNISGLAPYRLELEITESVLLDDTEQIRSTIAQIRALGVQIALDDFGAGYCGLRYLRQVEIDKIKLDKTMIDGVPTAEISKNILSGISHIADQMGITILAEGVDDIATAEFLALNQGIHQFQGFLFSKPVNAQEARRMQQFMPIDATSNNVVQLNARSNGSA